MPVKTFSPETQEWLDHHYANLSQKERHRIRLMRARYALEGFQDNEYAKKDVEGRLTDLISDLCHYATHKGLNPSSVLQNAGKRYVREHDKRQANARKHGRSVKGSPINHV
jgi:hypothetical protein